MIDAPPRVASPPDSPPSFAVLHATFSTYLPWSQPFLHDFFRAMERHTTNVVLCNRTENLDRFLLPHVYTVPASHLVHPSLGVLMAASLSRAWRPRVIHAHFGRSGVYALLLKQLLGIPLITTFGGRDASVHASLPHLNHLYALLFRASDRIVAVSAELRDQLVTAGAPGDRIEVIRRGTDVRTFAFVSRVATGDRQPARFLMVGRLAEKKGHRYALQAVRRLVDDGLNVRLTIVGDGSLAQPIRQLCGELGLDRNVQLTGGVDSSHVRQHMAESDVLVHCSVTGADGDREGIPNAVVEAAATGLPVVGTRHGGIVEAVEHGRTGLLVAERDVEGLASAMRQLAESTSLRLSMGEAAAQRARTDFDAERQVVCHATLYRDLVRNPPPASTWFPPDFPRLLVDSMRERTNANEYSLVELLALVGGPRRVQLPRRALSGARGRSIADDVRHRLARLSPRVKAVVRSGVVEMIRLRDRWRGPGPRVDPLDRMVLAYLARGGSLDALEEDWTLADLDAYLRRMEHPSSA
jgi:glycosyltransferase involved in cell wall biosynthesis